MNAQELERQVRALTAGYNHIVDVAHSAGGRLSSLGDKATTDEIVKIIKELGKRLLSIEYIKGS